MRQRGTVLGPARDDRTERATHAGASEPVIAEAIERLTPEFVQLSSGMIAGVVRHCRRDLDTSPTALPELLERLARQRLIDTLR
jgi:hypothetical protein